MATVLKQERRAVPLVTKDGKLQIEQFLISKSNYMTILIYFALSVICTRIAY